MADITDFETLYKSSFGYFVDFFVKRGFREARAQELADDTFLQVHKSLKSFKETGTLFGFARGIANHLWKNELRRIKTQKRDGQTVPMDDAVAQALPNEAASDPFDLLLKGEKKARLIKLMREHLPEQLADRLQMFYFEEKTYREIANTLGISEGTVKSQLNLARSRLKKVLEADLGEWP